MKIFHVIISCFIIVNVFSSCVQNSNCKETNEETIEKLVLNFFNNIGIVSKIEVAEEGQDLQIMIKYEAGYYLLEDTKELIFSYILYDLGNEIDSIKEISIIYRYDDLSDVKRVHYIKSKWKDRQLFFEQNICFRKAFLFTLKNMTTEEIIGYNELIKMINQTIPEFNFNGDYWSLLLSFSENCCNNQSVEYKNFDWLVKASSFPENPHKPELLIELVKLCFSFCKN